MLAPEYATAARTTRSVPNLRFGKVDCQNHPDFCTRKHIRSVAGNFPHRPLSSAQIAPWAVF